MKRTIKLALLLFGLIFAYNTSAQAQDIKAGGGLAYGSEVEAIGVQVSGVYDITEEVSGAADFIIFFPDGYDFWELNLNAHYGFYAEDNVRVYGLAGLNYATTKVDLIPSGSRSNSELGLNLGGGAEFGLDFANLYSELKYVLGDADQLAISAGLRFPI